VQKKFQDLFHRYKVHLFHREHDKQSVDELTRECLHITEDVLQQKYHYHFHKLPDANRAEIINMIQSYVREAILPPVIEKLVERQIRLEHRFDALQEFQRELLELLSQEREREGSAR
jgi:site-specific recombinase